MTKSSHVSAANFQTTPQCAPLSPEIPLDFTATQQNPWTCSCTGYCFYTTHQPQAHPGPRRRSVSGRLRLLRLLRGGRLITLRGCHLKEVIGNTEAFTSQLDCILRTRTSLQSFTGPEASWASIVKQTIGVSVVSQPQTP